METRSKTGSKRDDDKKRCEMGNLRLCPPISISSQSVPLVLPTPNVNLDCVSISILLGKYHLILHVSRYWRDACIGVLVFMVGPPFIYLSHNLSVIFFKGLKHTIYHGL